MDRPPVIDGTLTDDGWQNARVIADLPLQKGGTATQRTAIRLCYDNQAIYVAYDCAEDRMPELLASVTQTGGPLWRDDAVEVFVVPWHKKAAQFVTNPIASRYVGGADESWQVAVQKGASGWTAEFAIPFVCLGEVAPAKGDIWGINFGREEKPHGEVTAWSAPGYHDRDSDGDLVFE